MKTKFFAVLLGIVLISSPLYAQGSFKIIKNAGKAFYSGGRVSYNIIKTPRLVVTTPSLSTKVAAAVRRQTPALKRLTSVRQGQTYRQTVEAWRKRNISLAKTLDYHGVIVTRLPYRGKMVDSFSPDGVTWFQADEMLVSAVKNGHFVRVDEASGELWFSPYKGAPEFEFYNEQLFKELDRAKDLGAKLSDDDIVNTDGMWVDYDFEDIFNVKISYIGYDRKIVPWQQALAEWHQYGDASSCLVKSVFIVYEEGEELLESIKLLTLRNNMLVQLREWDKRAASLEKLNISVVWNPEEDVISLQDSCGVLHDTKDLNAVIQAEKELFSSRCSEIEAEISAGGFEKILQ